MSMDELTGETIVAVWLRAEEDIIAFVTESGRTLAYEAEGDCCAVAHFVQPEGFENLVGREVLSVDEGETTTTGNDDMGDVVDSFFVTFKSAVGIATLELRTEHNGYYCGFATKLDDDRAEMLDLQTFRRLA